MRVSALVRSLAVAAALAPAVASAQLSTAVPGHAGQGLVWLGNDLTFQGISKRAAYADYLFIFNQGVDVGAVRATANPLTAFAANFVGNNLPTDPTDHSLTFNTAFSVAALNALGIMTGQELVIAIFSQDINRWNFSGDLARNQLAGYANFYAANVNCADATTCTVGMEDKSQNEFGPNEPDRNDLIFSVTTTPEPGTIGLLATGLVGLAGVAARRRRKA